MSTPSRILRLRLPGRLRGLGPTSGVETNEVALRIGQTLLALDALGPEEQLPRARRMACLRLVDADGNAVAGVETADVPLLLEDDLVTEDLPIEGPHSSNSALSTYSVTL